MSEPRQLIGTCEHCKQLAPLFVVPSGELREPYLCEWCARQNEKSPEPRERSGAVLKRDRSPSA